MGCAFFRRRGRAACTSTLTRLAAVLVLVSFFQPLMALASEPSAEELLAWAERAYPEHFPGPQVTREASPYLYRYYPQTQNHVGVAGTKVSILGPISGGQVLEVGDIATFRCQIRPSLCVRPEGPRVAAGEAITLAVETSGRAYVLGVPGVFNDLQPATGSHARVLGVSARAVVAGYQGDGAVIREDGTAWAWSVHPQATWIDGNQPGASTTPRPMTWPGAVREVRIDAGAATALLEDGTVWQSGSLGEMKFVDGRYRFLPKQVRGLARVRSLSQGSAWLHALLEDGTVADVGQSSSVTRRVPDATAVRSVSCSVAHCLALRENGTVLSWGSGYLGDGKGSTYRANAGLVEGLSDVIIVATLGRPDVNWRSNDSAVVTADGQLWRWGDGDTFRYEAPRARPERVAGFGDVTDLNCGSHCVVRRRDGTVWGWGWYVSLHFNVDGPADFAPSLLQVPGLVVN